MGILIVSCIIIYVVSALWYWYLLRKESKEWFEGSYRNDLWSVIFLFVFGIIGLVPILNTVLAVRAHRDNIRSV